MTKQKRFIGIVLILVLFLASFLGFSVNQKVAMAQTSETEEPSKVTSEEDISARGLFTSLSLSINGGDGKIWVTVKNDVTIFPATVYVIVELYCSLEYQEKHEDMTLVSINSTMDLDMGKTIVAEASTGGVEQYWQGRMRYKIDTKAWEERNTGTVKYSAQGEPLGIL